MIRVSRVFPVTALLLGVAFTAAAAQEPHHPPSHGGGHGAHDGQAGGGHGLAATAGPGFTVADVEFMQMMIGHHAQALVMAEKAPTHGSGPEVRALSLKIEISQKDEIAAMQHWLRERDQEVPDEHHMHAMEMPGMVTPEQMARLDAARGTDFDRLFLRLMINHHLGAVDMVEALFAAPRAAQDPDIFRFATDVAADQLDEIGVMERILDRLSTSSRSQSR